MSIFGAIKNAIFGHKAAQPQAPAQAQPQAQAPAMPQMSAPAAQPAAAAPSPMSTSTPCSPRSPPRRARN